MTAEGEPAAASVRSSSPPPVTGGDQVESDLARRLSRVVESAVEVLGVDGIGLMLLDQHDALRTAGFTGLPTSTLERVQIELDEGPGIDASRRGTTIAVSDLAEAPAYGELWRRTADTGIRAVLSSPVRVWGAVIGNLNAVRHESHRWTPTEIRGNEAYAKVVGVTLDLAVRTVDSARDIKQTERSLRPDFADS